VLVLERSFHFDDNDRLPLECPDSDVFVERMCDSDVPHHRPDDESTGECRTDSFASSISNSIAEQDSEQIIRAISNKHSKPHDWNSICDKHSKPHAWNSVGDKHSKPQLWNSVSNNAGN
jgi:hypothetical protein